MLVPGGADWQLTRADGVTEIAATYLLRTDDGVLLTVTNRGIRHAPPDVTAGMLRGEAVDPGAVYFRCTPQSVPERHHIVKSSATVRAFRINLQ